MLSLKQFLINVASSISTLMSSVATKVDITTPLLNFDQYATTGDDKDLADTLTALGILNDVIQSE